MKQRLQNKQKKRLIGGFLGGVAIQASQHDVILEIRQFISSCGNWSHSLSNAVFICWMIIGEGLRVAIFLARASQTCSIGLRSEGLIGQSIQRTSSLSRNVSTRRSLCGLALSSIKMNSEIHATLKR
ncbi:hypothetical protein TNCV_4976711 [Trichonephila clavipes]|nr:hypothetical protein TNCV_4976711 [Trichonephila clavipes]